MGRCFAGRDVISITDFSREEIMDLLRAGERMWALEKRGQRNALRSSLATRSLASLFYEPSTRTRTSFGTAMRELGGQCDGFSGVEGTSVMKKETVRDTVMMMCANHFDAIVMRHPLDGSLQWAADVSGVPVINGGDGKNEHPTQAMLDILTLYVLSGGKLDGIRVGFGGDLSHGRTVRSLCLALAHFADVRVSWAADDFLGMPLDLARLLESRGVQVVRETSVRDVLSSVDFYYMTRPQLERMEKVSARQIHDMMGKYRIDPAKIEGFEAKIMHPLPVNSEIAEIDHRVYFSPAQVFFQQAEFGIFTRKAILHEMLRDGGYVPYLGELPRELGAGNNRLPRRITPAKNDSLFIDRIRDGTVLDHLKPGTIRAVDNILDLESRGASSIMAVIKEKRSPFLKTDLPELEERDLKRISEVSPQPTVNTIRGGVVVDKYVYLLCENTNCITRSITEDVPPRFYRDGGVPRCRYCRRSLAIQSHKVTEEEKVAYIAGLPTAILPVLYP
jgi:aspartate carbamoyltransferase catalytic subunit